jgi:hypothetical protein
VRSARLRGAREKEEESKEGRRSERMGSPPVQCAYLAEHTLDRP